MQETINLVKNVFDNFNKRAQLSLDEAIQLHNLHGRLQQEYNALAGQRDEAVRMLEEANKQKEAKPNPIPKQSQLKPVADKK